MFKRVLIANRGEIAVRIIRCCRELGTETVAVYSDVDEESLHVQLATYSVCIGPAKASESYLNAPAIITVAKEMKCDAIHPGFGFLSENSDFARLCFDNGIEFIGPSAIAIDTMGNKSSARNLMLKSGVPVVPGSVGLVKDGAHALEICDEIGYPVLIKASAGGGGRGMRRVFSVDKVKAEFSSARAEAVACFGNGDMYIEKLIENPRHIEFQILADKHGNVIHLGDRDCSVQRKNQKMIEESPSKALSDALRKEMGEISVKAAKAVNYHSAGTIEYVLDRDDNFYFIEMNTRIQVEHPVTEMVTGTDIVAEQMRIASGLELSKKQQDVHINGHAIECRINAEDPQNDFAPCPGTVEFVHMPGGNGVRVDSAIYTGYTIQPFYDSMVAKIIVHAPTRLKALRKMRRALEELIINGVKTNLSLQYLITYDKNFIKGDYDTSFIEKNLESLLSWE